MATRIQRQRTKGRRMPEGAVYVGRPTKYGNEWQLPDAAYCGVPIPKRRAWLVAQYRMTLGFTLRGDERLQWADELRGKNLVCWCPLDEPCHADVLLELANARRSVGPS